MVDIVVESHLKSFVDSYGYQTIAEAEKFERFCFYSLLSSAVSHSLNTEDLDDVSVNQNRGIDGISFIVNGKIVKDIDEIEQLKVSKQKISIDVYYIQAKKSESLSDSGIASFLDTILDFLNKDTKYTLTEEARRYHDIYLSILSDLNSVKEFNFHAFYCWLGTWNKNTSCAVTIQAKEAEIKDKKLFDKTEIMPIDKSKLIDMYKKASNPTVAEFEFSNKTEVNNVPNVEEAHIGLLPFSEFRKLIIDPDNGKLRNLFYDNVRDFLGDNEVNDKIKQTLDDKCFSDFSLLNNGITIIASENTGRSNKFIISNYQIVNGCQTSNILYECRSVEGIDNTMIPVKLIITQDENLRDRIILSTNNQTSIAEEELLALTKFQKRLEDYYASANDGTYYERRNNQYATKGIKKMLIIDIREQIKSFVAMFLDEPHEVSGQFGKVYKERKKEIFADEHLLDPYYISGLIQCRFKEFLSSKDIDRKYNKARYHVFMLFRMLHESEKFQKIFLKTTKKKAYFDNMLLILRDRKNCLSRFNSAFQIIDGSGIDIKNRREIYKKSTTNALIEEYNRSYK